MFYTLGMAEPTKLETALDELLSGKTTEEIVGPNGLLKQLTKALVERAMNAELSHHLGRSFFTMLVGSEGNESPETIETALDRTML